MKTADCLEVRNSFPQTPQPSPCLYNHTFKNTKFYRYKQKAVQSRCSPSLVLQCPHDPLWSFRNLPVPNVSSVTRPNGMCESCPGCHVTEDKDRKKRQLPTTTSLTQSHTHTLNRRTSTLCLRLSTPSQLSLSMTAKWHRALVQFWSFWAITA